MSALSAGYREVLAFSLLAFFSRFSQFFVFFIVCPYFVQQFTRLKVYICSFYSFQQLSFPCCQVILQKSVMVIIIRGRHFNSLFVIPSFSLTLEIIISVTQNKMYKFFVNLLCMRSGQQSCGKLGGQRDHADEVRLAL